MMEQTATLVKTRSFLPNETQDLLMYWRDKFKQGYFEIGDIAAEFVVNLSMNNVAVTQQQVFDEIGRFSGKSGRTVRYYYETAIFYPESVRDRYAALPFSHFVFARSFGDWQTVLELALEHPEYSEDQLRRTFLGTPPVLSEYSLTTQENDALERAQNAQDERATDQGNSNRYRYFQALNGLREGVQVIRELLDKMDEEDRQSYSDLLYQLEPALNYLPQVIEKAV